MNGYINTWSEFEEWISDNKIKSWRISVSKGDGNDNCYLFSTDKEDSHETNLEVTKRRLEGMANSGKTLYLKGWRNPDQKNGGFAAEIRYGEVAQQQPAYQQMAAAAVVPTIGGLYDGVGGRETLIRDITTQVKNEYDSERIKSERDLLNEEKRKFQEERDSVLGLLIDKLAPVAQAWISGMAQPRTRIAGVADDSEMEEQSQQPIADPKEEQSPLTEEEEDKLLDLMVRFKQVEPAYLQLIESVVVMAEQKDATYTMAKQFLLKQ